MHVADPPRPPTLPRRAISVRIARISRPFAALLAGLLAVPALACAPETEESPVVSRGAPIVPLDTGTVFIETEADTFRLSVEIAETPTQREIGLMERMNLPEDEGMIFLSYEEQDSTAGFYMFRTRIPLDIAFLDRDGRIVAIRSMEPCASPVASYCQTYEAGVPYWGALEVNGGYFGTRSIEVGDRVTLRRAGRVTPLPDTGRASP